MKNNASGGVIYGTAVVGALFYFLSHAHTFSDIVIGIVKSLFWPGVLVFKALELLKL